LKCANFAASVLEMWSREGYRDASTQDTEMYNVCESRVSATERLEVMEVML